MCGYVWITSASIPIRDGMGCLSTAPERRFSGDIRVGMGFLHAKLGQWILAGADFRRGYREDGFHVDAFSD